MKMTDLLRIIEKMRLMIVVILLLFASGYVQAMERDALAIRREYNDVSAAIDSLVRMMQGADAEVLKKLPEARAERILPEGMTAVMIFWADDEARVWLNDFPVGETRLTPVEVTVPDLYFQGQNRLRVRCWDTDRVESGFLGGLYLKDGAGRLYPIVVSNEAWETAGGRATEITYAHPMPDIPGAQPIWSGRMFGVVDMAITFDRGAIDRALAESVRSMTARQQAMDYHTFAQQIAVLQARREKLSADLGRQGDLNVPIYNRDRARSASLSLGKAAPLAEKVSAPVAKNVRSWSEKLPAVQQQLIYPDRRALKGEGAVTTATGDVVPTASDRGSREQAYRPPEERGGMKDKTKEQEKEVNAQVQPQGMRRGGGGGQSSQATRLGLLLPTLIVGIYVLYVTIRWQSLMGERD